MILTFKLFAGNSFKKSDPSLRHKQLMWPIRTKLCRQNFAPFDHETDGFLFDHEADGHHQNG